MTTTSKYEVVWRRYFPNPRIVDLLDSLRANRGVEHLDVSKVREAGRRSPASWNKKTRVTREGQLGRGGAHLNCLAKILQAWLKPGEVLSLRTGLEGERLVLSMWLGPGGAPVVYDPARETETAHSVPGSAPESQPVPTSPQPRAPQPASAFDRATGALASAAKAAQEPTAREVKIRKLLIEQGLRIFRAPRAFHEFTGVRAADDLLNDLDRHPHAFVIGCLMDRQIPAESAWLIPYRISEKLDGFSMETLCQLSRADVNRLMTQPEPLHRFVDKMSGFFQAAVQRISEHYAGDAARIWEGRTSSPTVASLSSK